jgi:hypothetical protein
MPIEGKPAAHQSNAVVRARELQAKLDDMTLDAPDRLHLSRIDQHLLH